MCYQKYRPAVLKAYNYCCAWCGIEDWGGRGETLCLDHVETQFSGGSDTLENLQLLCRRCNSIKGPYNMPKLAPRMPAANLQEAHAAQEKLKHKIMPARRRTCTDNHIPRTVLGY